MHFYQSFIYDEAALSVLIWYTTAVDELPWYFTGAIFISLLCAHALLDNT